MWAIAAKAHPLPISLISFTGSPMYKTNALAWKTAVESNNKYFSIEKSTDGINFEALAEVPSKGNTSTGYEYSIFDNTPYAETYYRLSQTDMDGQRTSIKIISVAHPVDAAEKLVYPYKDQ